MMINPALRSASILFAAVTAAGFGVFVAAAQTVPNYAAILAAPDRSEADRNTDKRRDPTQLLPFTSVRTAATAVLR